MKYFNFQDKELEKLLKNINDLLIKIIKFNIAYPCQLTFGFDKSDFSIFPIVSHHEINDFNYKFYLYDNKLLINEEESELLTEIDYDKFNNRIDLLSIHHNVILSTHELDLSLKRDDLYIYSEPITVFIPQKLKDFINLRLISDIEFIYDENNNLFSINDIKLYDCMNPITIRQKEIYLSNKIKNIGFFNKNRDKYLNETILKLCDLHLNNKNPNYFNKILTKEDNLLEEIIINKELNIKIPKEFIKANAKKLNTLFLIEKGKNNSEIIANLSHIEYNSKSHQYIFYRYYNIKEE